MSGWHSLRVARFGWLLWGVVLMSAGDDPPTVVSVAGAPVLAGRSPLPWGHMRLPQATPSVVARHRPRQGWT
jgi:hypothetical protein